MSRKGIPKGPPHLVIFDVGHKATEGKTPMLKVGRLVLKFHLCHLLAMQPWTKHFPSSRFKCKNGAKSCCLAGLLGTETGEHMAKHSAGTWDLQGLSLSLRGGQGRVILVNRLGWAQRVQCSCRSSSTERRLAYLGLGLLIGCFIIYRCTKNVGQMIVHPNTSPNWGRGREIGKILPPSQLQAHMHWSGKKRGAGRCEDKGRRDSVRTKCWWGSLPDLEKSGEAHGRAES